MEGNATNCCTNPQELIFAFNKSKCIALAKLALMCGYTKVLKYYTDLKTFYFDYYRLPRLEQAPSRFPDISKTNIKYNNAALTYYYQS